MKQMVNNLDITANPYADTFSKSNIITYLLVLFLPLIGIYRVIKSKSLRNAAKLVWIMIGCVVCVQQVMGVVNVFN